jgi:hypothetical protein
MLHFPADNNVRSELLGFGLCPSSGILEARKYNVSEIGCFRPQVRRIHLLNSVHSKELTSTAFSKGPNWVSSTLPSPEDENSSNFRNFVFSSF